MSSNELDETNPTAGSTNPMTTQPAVAASPNELPPLAKALFGAGDLDAAHTSMQAEMEALSEQLRLAALKCDAKQLIGFLWAQLLMGQLAGSEEDERLKPADALDDVMFALEYVHATLSAHPSSQHGTSAESGDLNEVLALATKLRHDALLYCLVAARRVPDGLFGPETGTVAMQAMTSWVTLRGHRYQALEREFLEFVLSPHDAALHAVYGVGASEIAVGIQAAVDATRFGHMKAVEALQEASDAAHELAERENIDLGEAVHRLQAEDTGTQRAAVGAISDLFLGGICNVAKTSGLPALLLEDLAYRPGEETEFFAPGPLRGTPLRRMPGRVKPFVSLEDGVYTCDGNFMRDSAYRALQWGLLRRLPDYKEEWTARQTQLTETAFSRIFSKQLAGADELLSIYYPDPDTGKWVENDVLILLNDALLQVEVKAGVMPMHSPELHFERHVRAIQDLVIKAHHQCERFLRYAASAPEVPIYQLVNGRHQEVRRLRLNDYRVVLPIGLTVEAFTPFSSMSKRLPEARPILGKHPFISMSIDDLFVLARFLPTTGELMHYLTVRQGVASVTDAMVFDELDHLGAYVTQNRADQFYRETLAEGATWMTHADACAPIDAYFANPDWENIEPPRQQFPKILGDFLVANDAARGARFLAADAVVRDMGGEGRTEMANHIEALLPSLSEHPYRWFTLQGDEPLLVWMQRRTYVDLIETHKAKAEAVCLAFESKRCVVLMVYVNPDGTIAGGWARAVAAPIEHHLRYSERLAEAARLRSRMAPLTPEGWLQLANATSRRHQARP